MYKIVLCYGHFECENVEYCYKQFKIVFTPKSSRLKIYDTVLYIVYMQHNYDAEVYILTAEFSGFVFIYRVTQQCKRISPR